MASKTLTYIDSEELFKLVPPAAAVDALREALRGGFDPEHDSKRTSADLPTGQMLLMPSGLPEAAGIKVLTLKEDNPEAGLPMIQGQYLLFDGPTLTPTAVVDGEGVTNLRTPALSLAGVKEYVVERAQANGGQLKVVIFGTGVQARYHQLTVNDVLGNDAQAQFTFISRSKPEGDNALSPWAQAGSDEALAALSEADLVLCCTTSPTPIVEADQVREDAIIVALGSHTTTNRELSGELVGSAQVIIESRDSAEREAGDVTLAIEDGHLSWEDTHLFKDVVSGTTTLDPSRRIIFKTTGMPWEDLVLAQAAYTRSQ